MRVLAPEPALEGRDRSLRVLTRHVDLAELLLDDAEVGERDRDLVTPLTPSLRKRTPPADSIAVRQAGCRLRTMTCA